MSDGKRVLLRYGLPILAGVAFLFAGAHLNSKVLFNIGGLLAFGPVVFLMVGVLLMSFERH